MKYVNKKISSVLYVGSAWTRIDDNIFVDNVSTVCEKVSLALFRLHAHEKRGCMHAHEKRENKTIGFAEM